MKDSINAILVSDTHVLLPDEMANYLIQKDGEIYKISDIPISFKGNISEIRNYIAYDYDLLKSKNQEKFKNYVLNFICINQNQYKLNTKIYQFRKRKNYFPKQN